MCGSTPRQSGFYLRCSRRGCGKGNDFSRDEKTVGHTARRTACGAGSPHHQAAAQGGRGFLRQEWIVERGDSIPHIYLLPVYVFDRPVDLRRYQKLVRAVKRVYPMAQTARAKMAEMEGILLELPTKKAQKAYIKQVYNQIKEEYTPVAKHMTRTEGHVLLKLIDRETDYTAYEVLREFRGGFVAGFWQGISRIFGQNLKSEYDREGGDRIIEQIVIYYEAGLL